MAEESSNRVLRRARYADLDEEALREAALRHLGRYAATRASLMRVLMRRVYRAGLPHDEAAGTAQRVVERLAAAGHVDDAAFAASRARRLRLAGRSMAATRAHLAAKGVEEAIVKEAVAEDDDLEFVSALAYAKRRGFGAFAGEGDERARKRALGAMGRAGFGVHLALRALGVPREDAESILAKRRRER